MTDGTRTQEVHPWEDSVKQLKETSNQQSLELKELARMMIAMNLKIDHLIEKSLVSMVSTGVCGIYGFGRAGGNLQRRSTCNHLSYRTAKSGVGVASMGVMRSELVMKSIVPVVMAGVLGIYGLIIVVIIRRNHYSIQTLEGKHYGIDFREKEPNRYQAIRLETIQTLKLNDQEFLEECSCQNLTLDLHNKNGNRGLKNLGKLIVHAEETVASRNSIDVIFHCSHLENKDLVSKSDPFLRISRMVEHGGFVSICKTEVVDNNLNPIWRPLRLTMKQFVSKDNLLVIECFDFNTSGNNTWKNFINKKKKKKNGANFILPSSDQLFVDQFCEKQLYSFIDYVSSGYSLHYIDPFGRFNAYQQAIMDVEEVIQFYDSDRRFPAWGFGGRIMDGTISHCFNLNGSASGVEVERVQEIMAAYASALNHVALGGPTLFGQVINNVVEIAGHSLCYNNCKYFVLLIITNGVLTDLQETKYALVKASDFPLSILIVGSSAGRVATRDIVQFVPMKEFLTYMRCSDIKPSAINIAQTSASHATI
ncbi:hypothetical protein AAG906_041180 [Vitis piasezkii]